MNHDRFFLKPSVKMEPLWNQWYAWPLLISPSTAPSILANQHLRIMESYLQNPRIHRAAAKSPAMRGGPFLDYDGDDSLVAALVDSTKREHAALLEFAAAVKSLDQMLQAEANGGSLEEFYPRVPDPLRGYVELGYDLNDRPSIRFLESLLYASPYYKADMQSLMLSIADDDSRPFLLSTPRFETANQVKLNVPFAATAIDTLFAMRHTPQPKAVIDRLADELGVREEIRTDFLDFFTTEAAPSPKLPPAATDGVRIRYLGHAAVLIESREITILIDPLISYHNETGLERYTLYDLPERIDYVLLTHNHQDHVMFETLLQLRHKIGTIVVPRSSGGPLQDPSLRLALKAVGFKSVIELDELEEIDTGNGRIVGVPFFGEHSDLHIRSKSAYFVALNGHTMLFAADSNNLEPRMYEHVRAVLGKVEHVFLGMECDGAPMSWLYGPLFSRAIDRKSDNARRLNGSRSEGALSLVAAFSPRATYVYAMGQEPWLGFISSIAYTSESLPIVESDKFVAACREAGIEAERLYGMRLIELD